MLCPRDGDPLKRVLSDHATSYVCGRCAGRALTVTLLRRMMPKSRLRELWALVRGGSAGKAACPSCEGTMNLVAFHDGPGTLSLDGCAVCSLIWFDAGELRAVAPNAASPSHVLDAPVPGDASEQWAWGQFFHRLNAHRANGPDGLGVVDFL